MEFIFLNDRVFIRQAEEGCFLVKATLDGSNLKGLDWLSFKLSAIFRTYVKVSYINREGGRRIVWLNKNSLWKRAILFVGAPLETAMKIAMMAKFKTFISSPTQEKLSEFVDQTREVAARNVHLGPLVDRFIEDGTFQSRPALFEYYVRNAVVSRDLVQVRLLLSSGIPLSWGCMCDVVERAVGDVVEGHSNLDMLGFLLSNERTVPQSAIECAVSRAVGANRSDILEFVLSNGRTISERERRRHIYGASGPFLNSAGVLEVLLRLGPIDRSVRDYCLSQARNNDQVRELLYAAPIEEIRTRPVEGVAGAQTRVLEHNEYYLSLEDVATNPRGFLDTIYADGLPRKIYLLDSPTSIDLGGITKQFFTTLIKAIKSKEIIALSTSGLPLVREDRSDENKRELEKMGKLYALIDEKNQERSDKYVLGQLFNPKFFNLVKIALRETSLENKLKDVARCVKEIDPVYTLTANLIIDPSETNKAAYCEAMGLEELGDEEMNEAKKVIQGYFEAAEAFARGMTPGFRTKLLEGDSVSLMTSLQGAAISSEGLIASLTIVSPNPQLNQKVEWIREKIRSSSLEWMEQFLKSITGQQTLSLGLSIRLNDSSRNVFEIHTCFNSLKLPSVEMTKEDFLAALEVSIAGSGYNTR